MEHTPRPSCAAGPAAGTCGRTGPAAGPGPRGAPASTPHASVALGCQVGNRTNIMTPNFFPFKIIRINFIILLNFYLTRRRRSIPNPCQKDQFENIVQKDDCHTISKTTSQHTNTRTHTPTHTRIQTRQKLLIKPQYENKKKCSKSNDSNCQITHCKPQK